MSDIDLARVEVLQLISFLTVAEAGSFRQGAFKLEVGQSTVSRRMQRLEDHLGVSLFERRTNGVRLTFAGKRFSARGRAVLADLASAVDTARAGGIAGNGDLAVGLITSLSRGPVRALINRFRAEHGDVDLHLTEADRGELLSLLCHRRMDVVLASGEPSPEDGDGLLFARERIFLAVASDHRWAELDQLRWEDVRKATYVVSAREPGPEIHDYILRRVSDLGRSANVRRHRLGREGIMNLVGLGLGVSLVADHWRGVQYPNVTFVPIGEAYETIPFSLVWRPENDNPALRRFISLARIEAKRNGVLS
ncbi:LysR family transcriptional regulator [Actibacterium sp. 188UL27-1]|uniref:LysR family transcriptional regulator n=1 Tax=Actibacterium sp. 188UL27-1 TaxID=2786961 RepID=UPI00195843A0|nr:LysR family transcriptional regulator [Actibacterium sp. 188UL27-1]